MNCEQARETLIDALSGPVEPEREQAVERHLLACDACGDEAAALRRTWAALADVGDAEVPSDRMRVRFRAALGAYEAALERSWSRRLAGWARHVGDGFTDLGPVARAAVAAALLVAGVALGWGSSRVVGPGREAARLRAEIDSMNRAVTLALLDHQSASERLRGVSWVAATPDDAVLTALVEAAQHDESVNVRLAAVEALAAHLERPAVRSGLLRSLEQRPQPHLQLAVSRLFADEDEGGDELERLLASDLLDPEVRRLLLDESGEL